MIPSLLFVEARSSQKRRGSLRMVGHDNDANAHFAADSRLVDEVGFGLAICGEPKMHMPIAR